MVIFHSKHQRLILQCYPPGKGIDKKPNPSELSYLLYYASTRRIKLEKVSVFLENKTVSDCNHNRSGNLMVTLSICSALIEQCCDNLNVFASYVCSILKTVSETGDLYLNKQVVDTFGVLCSKLDGTLFTGDKVFVELFNSLALNLVERGFTKSNLNGPNRMDWQLLSISSCKYLANCLGHNAKFGKKFINICIPLLTRTAYEGTSEDLLLAKLKSNVNADDDKVRLTSESSRPLSQTGKLPEKDIYNDVLSQSDLTEEALQALKAFFYTSLTNQIAECTRAIVKYNQSSGVDLGWSCTFLEMCTSWIPVQLRFIALSTLLTSLNSLAQQASSKESNYSGQSDYAHHILGLVSSDVNMIGLSISDLIQQMVVLKTGLILRQSDFLSKKEIDDLSSTYSSSICNLSTHIYYYDQVPDSIYSIFIKLNNLLDIGNLPKGTTGDKMHNIITSLLDDIAMIFKIVKKKSSNISRNHVSLENWELSLSLLSPDLALRPLGPERNLLLSPEQLTDIRTRYLNVFQDFLLNELDGEDDTNLFNESISIDNVNAVSKTHLKPNHKNYISDEEGFITTMLAYVNRYLSDKSSTSKKESKHIYEVLRTMASIFGINFTSNLIPFFFYWQLPVDVNSADRNGITKDTLAYSLVFYSLTAVDKIYKLDYITHSKFYSALLGNIHFRKLNHLWDNELELPSDAELFKTHKRVSGMENGGFRINLTKKDLEGLVEGNSFLSEWVDPQRNIKLELTADAAIAISDQGRSKSYPHNNSDSESLSEAASNNTTNKLKGLGLGNSNDISSIHSGILMSYNRSSSRNGTLNTNGDTSIGSIYTSEGRSHYTPKVADLKESVLCTKKSVTTMNDQYTSSGTPSNSVLSKNMAQSDIGSILDGLDSDDDVKVVV